MEQYNPGQIRRFLKQLQQREEQYVYYLGQLAYQAGERGLLSEPAMLEAYRTLKEIKAQIAQWEETLARIKSAKEAAQRPRCPNCGGEVVKGALYCPSCGGALASPSHPAAPAAAAGSVPPSGMPGASAPATAPPPMPGAGVPMPPAAAVQPPTSPAVPTGAHAAAQAARSCPRCGAPLDEDAVFCGNCGVRVSVSVATASGAPQEGAGAEAASTPETPGGGEKGSGMGPEAGTEKEEVPTGDVGTPGVDSAAQPVETAGAAQPGNTEEELSAEETVACPSCWTAITDLDARFCPNCGSKVRE